MPPLKIALAVILVFGAPAGAAMAETKTAFDFGQPITSADLQRYLSIPPNGAGLPPGHGDASQGRMVYEEKCAACHGEKLEGISRLLKKSFCGAVGV